MHSQLSQMVNKGFPQIPRRPHRSVHLHAQLQPQLDGAVLLFYCLCPDIREGARDRFIIETASPSPPSVVSRAPPARFRLTHDVTDRSSSQWRASTLATEARVLIQSEDKLPPELRGLYLYMLFDVRVRTEAYHMLRRSSPTGLHTCSRRSTSGLVVVVVVVF